MKKILLAVFIFLFLALGQAQADLLPLVQCGGSGQSACTFCSFFDMISRIIQFGMTRIIPSIAVLMLVIGGGYFFFAGADPGKLETGKKILTSTIWGIAIIFTAFLIIGTILSAIGLAAWTENIYKDWWDQGFFKIPGC